MITIKNIIDFYSSKQYRIVLGDKKHWEDPIVMPRAIQIANENHFTFISNKFASEYHALIQATKSRVVLVEEILYDSKDTASLPSGITFILSENPKKDLIDFANHFFSQKIELTATSIHPNACVAKGASIGSQVSIGPAVVIEDNVTIGDRSTIGAGTVIKRNTTIGEDVIVGSCNVIGGDGFGYVKNDDTGEYEHFPHYGGVKISNNVHIGNNTCIDRGSLKDTVIGENVKIDNLVHIAHNVEIGKNSLIIACSMVAGSVTIGENSWVAPSSTIRNAITIGSNTTIGLASTVTKNVEDNATVMGNPAIKQEDFLLLRKQQKRIIAEQKDNTKNSGS